MPSESRPICALSPSRWQGSLLLVLVAAAASTDASVTNDRFKCLFVDFVPCTMRHRGSMSCADPVHSVAAHSARVFGLFFE